MVCVGNGSCSAYCTAPYERPLSETRAGDSIKPTFKSAEGMRAIGQERTPQADKINSDLYLKYTKQQIE